jgi:hypothetical protein
MAPGASASPATSSLPEGLLLDLLAVSLTGVNVLRPLHGPAGELTDFFFVYINTERGTSRHQRRTPGQ